MKTKLIPLSGDLIENLYQLGLTEKDAFRRLEERVTRLLSTSNLLRQGQDILNRARASVRKRQNLGFFEECVQSYAEGLGVPFERYMSFLSLFEIAAHYGQIYPELKGLLPGCASVFQMKEKQVTHARLLDFPLIGVFEESPRLYYWHSDGRPSVLSYSCAGLAPLFFQCVHESGISFALHHKPGKSVHSDGQSVFQIIFETLFTVPSIAEFKKELRKKSSVTKWSYLLADASGQVQVIDQDGPRLTSESYHLTESGPLIFTNIPLQNDTAGFESFLSLCEERQVWIKEKLAKQKSTHTLDLLTDVSAQSEKKWIHPGSTLSTVAAYEVNLGLGYLDLKEGSGAMVSADEIVRVSLGKDQKIVVLKNSEAQTQIERAWKLASTAQSDFDQGYFPEAYHHLQMAEAIMPHKVWKNIFTFYLCLWDFRFVSNTTELSHTYKKVKHLMLPPQLKEEWSMFMMRLEKRLDLSFSIHSRDISEGQREIFEQELKAPRPVFLAWMKLLYPRLEILGVFSPHDQKQG